MLDIEKCELKEGGNQLIDKFIEYAMQWNMNVYEVTPAMVGLTEKLQNNRNRNNSKIEV